MHIRITIARLDGKPTSFAEAEEEGVWDDVLKFISQGFRVGHFSVGELEYVWKKEVSDEE